MKVIMMVEWNWRKSRIISTLENEHLVQYLFDLEFNLFRLFLILIFVAETDVVSDLFLNFERKWASCS